MEDPDLRRRVEYLEDKMDAARALIALLLRTVRPVDGGTARLEDHLSALRDRRNELRPEDRDLAAVEDQIADLAKALAA